MERIVTGLLLGIALFWAGACFWIRGDGVPDWWLPVAFAAGIAYAVRMPRTTEVASPRWARTCTWMVIGTAFAALWRGALATGSRHWDGAASLDAKVFWLQQAPTLQQPFFATEGVFHHSPDYPLLLPLLVAMAERLAPDFGRIVLPLIYMLMLGVVASALSRRAVKPLLRLAVITAVAVTPHLLTSGGGGVDSGYGECLLLLATTTVAAGLLMQSSLWFSLGIVLLIAAKPEGLPYAVIALVVALARGERRLLWQGTAALACACMVWEPVRAALLHQDYGANWPLAGLVLTIISFLLAAKPADPIYRVRERTRWLILMLVPIAGLLMLPWIAPMFAASTGTLALYLRQGENVWTGFGNLPAYAAGVVEFGVSRMRLGTVLLLPIAIAIVAWRRRIALADRSLLAFALFGLLTTALPFVLSPEPNFEHHLRSSLTRLLLHWIGPLWLLNACWLNTMLAADSVERCQSPTSTPS
ncbi:MAG: hypothetical protein ACJA0V_003189 [Planctomycetota bacterium]|jgi:hypothetical protein